MKILKLRETWFHLAMIAFAIFIAVQSIAQDPVRETWPADGDAFNWVAAIDFQITAASSGSEVDGPDRKETYLIAFAYYRGFALREVGVVQVETDAFLYDVPQGKPDDRLMNDVLVALMKQGIRVDVTRRGEWVQVGPWSKKIPPTLIFDSRNLPQRPKN